MEGSTPVVPACFLTREEPPVDDDDALSLLCSYFHLSAVSCGAGTVGSATVVGVPTRAGGAEDWSGGGGGGGGCVGERWGKTAGGRWLVPAAAALAAACSSAGSEGLRGAGTATVMVVSWIPLCATRSPLASTYTAVVERSACCPGCCGGGEAERWLGWPAAPPACVVVMVGRMPAAACTSSMGTLTLAAEEGMGLTVTAAVSIRLPRLALPQAPLLPPAAVEAAATLPPPLSIFWNRLPSFAAKTGVTRSAPLAFGGRLLLLLLPRLLYLAQCSSKYLFSYLTLAAADGRDEALPASRVLRWRSGLPSWHRFHTRFTPFFAAGCYAALTASDCGGNGDGDSSFDISGRPDRADGLGKDLAPISIRRPPR